MLPRVGRIRGRVLDAAGQPVAGAWVGDDDEALLHSPTYVTNAEGVFAIAVPQKSIQLLALAQGHAPSEVLELEAGPGEEIADIVLRLREPCRLEGRVVDALGRPISGARVFVEELDFRSPEFCDEAGAFVLADMPPGTFQLTAIRDDGERAMATAVLAPGLPSTVELRFTD